MDILLIILGILVLLIAIILFNTLKFGKEYPAAEKVDLKNIDEEKIATHLSKIIQINTVSYENVEPDKKAFDELHKTLKEMYPLVHKTCSLEKINNFSLLYKWEGSDSKLDPICLMAHQDVVPANKSSLDKWTYPPFSGTIADGYIWGRGTLDIKNQLIANIEAVEYLIEEGFQPKRSVYLSFGHDEEIGGGAGAKAVVKHLASQGVHLEAVIDEGGMINQNALPGVPGKIALIGMVEKGYSNIELHVNQPPGHSAMPNKETTITILAEAITKINKNPMPANARYIKPMFEGLGKTAPFYLRMLFANLWIFGPLANFILSKNNTTNASIRTTAVPTIINGGDKENVVPNHAFVNINSRLMPGTTYNDVIAHFKKVINDERIEFKVNPNFCVEASAISSMENPAFDKMVSTVRQVFGEMPVTFFLMLGGTDSRNFCEISDNVHRFSPCLLDKESLPLIHGIDERIKITELKGMAQFLIQYIKNFAG